MIRGSSDKDRGLLERLSRGLLQSVEALGLQELEGLATPSSMMKEYGYLPMIVTNAKLYSCEYEPAEVDLETGLIEGAEIKEQPLIRFEKSLVEPSVDEGLVSLASRNRGSKRTICVANACHLNEILLEWVS